MSEDDEGDETKANCEVDFEITYRSEEIVRNIGVVEIKAALSRSGMPMSEEEKLLYVKTIRKDACLGRAL